MSNQLKTLIMYKYLISIFITLTFFSCYKDEYVFDQSSNSGNQTFITNNPCFDILFPATVTINNRDYIIYSYGDYSNIYDSLKLSNFIPNLTIELKYPYYLLDSNYEIIMVKDSSVLFELEGSCNEQLSYLHAAIYHKSEVQYCYEIIPRYIITWYDIHSIYTSNINVLHNKSIIDYVGRLQNKYSQKQPVPKLNVPITYRNSIGEVIRIDRFETLDSLRYLCN